MPDQTMNPATRNGAPPEAATVGDVTASAQSLAHDLITLTELQAKLLYIDVREAGQRSAGSAVSLAAMLGLLLSAVPVILLGIADLIGDATGWRPGLANLLVGGVAGAVGVLAGWISFTRLRRVTTVFSRTQQELTDNLAFIKSLVSGTSRSGNGRWPATW